MALVNPNFLQFPKRYLFSTIEEKVLELRKKEANADILNLGVGDVALPLAQAIAEALKDAAEEMKKTVYGYGPSAGYLFLREKLLETEYAGQNFSSDEIFISEGIVRDICDIQELFHEDATVGIIDPTYPAYFDTSTLAGRCTYRIPCLEKNGFIPLPPDHAIDFVYLCSPNNPTGIAMTRSHLKMWIDWARKHQSILLFDAAYEAFITSEDVPKTIYEIEGAKEVAIEFRSFSKAAGFTGLRLGYTIIPKELPFNALWKLRQDIKTNGVSYPIQRAGMQALCDPGKKEAAAQVALYASHAKKLKHHIESLGFTCYGGKDSPYIWWKINSPDSWHFFDHLLNKLHLITIPGRGFGLSGEGFIRVSSFITETTLEKTLHRLYHFKDTLCAMK